MNQDPMHQGHDVIENAAEARSVASVVTYIRPAVRAQQVYAVRHYPDVGAKLNQNESPYDLPPELKQAVVDALLARDWNRYPTDYADPLRAALAEHLGLEPEAVLLSNGSNDLIYSVGLAVIEMGTPVVLPVPLFSLYRKIVRLLDGEPVQVMCRDDYTFDPEAIVAAARRTQAPLIALANPNSPLGTAMPLDAVEHIAAEAPGFVLVDEAYHEFVEGPNALHLWQRYPNVIALRTFSKAIGLAGLRLGYLVGHPSIVGEIQKLRLPFVINILTETIGLKVLEQPEFIAERVRVLKESRAVLYAELKGIKGVRVVASDTNFLIFKTRMNSGRLVEELAARDVLIRDVSSYPGLEHFVRVSVGTVSENQAFMSALKHVLDGDRVS